ncbi:probable cytochrome P450 6g2 [Lutzomyia longipalpis]|uniref:probable cytochrome P450 6g2 n=1 Tax=Lutzomyia longipalpis TaxID=7200 RepID=UPI0024845192|nr:probable cytochrome P450 6g2 [Lutzomyia longipalpis]
MFALQVILGLILCIGALLWWWQRSARLYWEKNGVSYIPGPPFIGALKDCLTFRKSIGELLLDIYNHEKFKDDPVTGVYFFHEPILVIRHPELIKNILVKDFPNFMDRGVNGDTYHDLIATDNLFVVKGHRWQTIRNKLSPVFTTGKLKNLFLLMVNVTKILEQKLETEIGDQSKEYEMKEFASFFSTDTIALCAFGVQLATLFRFALFSKETNEFLRSSVNCVMEERIKSGSKRNDLIDALIAMREEDSDLFKGDTLVAQAAAFIIAGYESSSSAIAFALYELAQNQEIQEKLRKEIKSYIEKYESIQYETVHEMKYLHCVVQEIFRLYPSLPFLERICTPTDGKSTYSLEPYHKFAVPSGMSVYIPLLAIHRDPNYFPDPMKFIPERFDSTSWDLAHQNAFMAFGLGPRSCIGSRFGYLQVKLALITILRNYLVEASERTPKTIKLDKKAIVIRSQEPLYLNLIRI